MNNKKQIKIITAVAAIVIVFLIVVFSVIIPNVNYNKAETLMSEKKYAEAIKAFENLDDFKDSKSKATECTYLHAIEIMTSGDYVAASDIFLSLKDYKDSSDKSNECLYLYAVGLADKKDYEEANKILKSLDDYKDSKDKISENKYFQAIECTDNKCYTEALMLFREIPEYKDSAEQIIKIEKLMLQSAKVGDTIQFGTYNQDENAENGNEVIDWVVLEKKGSKALVISKNILANRQFHRVNKEITWDMSNLRRWLDWDFEEEAFSDEEKNMLVKVTLENTDNPIYDADGGPDTEDKIFILGYEEVKKYFPEEESRIASGCGTNKWWIRTPAGYNLKNFVNSFFHGSGSGKSQFCPCYVDVDGGICAGGEGGLITDPCGIRPAMWIKIK